MKPVKFRWELLKGLTAGALLGCPLSRLRNKAAVPSFTQMLPASRTVQVIFSVLPMGKCGSLEKTTTIYQLEL